MLKLSKNAEVILHQRYLLKDKHGKVRETPAQMFKRVAKAAAKAEALYSQAAKQKYFGDRFFEIMSEGLFLPNSPALMNAGTDNGQLSACFVLPVEDSLQSIFSSLKDMALIQQSGGGTGFNFGRLRRRGEAVKKTRGIASGPVSFMKIFDSATDIIRQGGRRRGANMGILPADHPDIMEFINAKKDGKVLSNFNLSVAISDKFMEALKKGRAASREVFSKIVENAWAFGDPGVLFIDRINKENPLPRSGNIEATNPCGEQPLLPYESCNLGSIDISKFVKGSVIDYKGLKETVELAVRFLDDLIDVNIYPLPQIEAASKDSRKIGLGIMGFADLLIKLNIPYASQKAVVLAEKIMKFIQEEARAASVELGKIKGSFPLLKESIYKSKYKFLRNASLTTIAPTGSLSIIAGCSGGIEPIFAASWTRVLEDGQELQEHNAVFEMIMKKRKLWNDSTVKNVLLNEGSLKGFDEIPDNVKSLFTRAQDIPARWHVNIAAAFQKYTDSGVSKTVNLSVNSSQEDVRDIFILAHKLKCKGITVFRCGCGKEEVLSIKPEDTGRIVVESEFPGGSPVSYCGE
jgi:ribonucleoside-diphosphate reductase alpha chain